MALIPRLRPVLSAASRIRPQRYQKVAAFATEPTKKTTPPASIEPNAEQAMPIGGFYENMMNYKMPPPNHFPRGGPASSTVEEKTPEPKPKSSPEKPEPELKPKIEPKDEKPTPTREKGEEELPGTNEKKKPTKARARRKTTTTTTETKASAEERPKIVFGSTLAGPARRAALNKQKSTVIAGVRVPPKPEEPDNCCMSGCVNCVWEQFREDMEAWSLANSESQRRLAARTGATITPTEEDAEGSWSTEPPKISKDLWDEELYKDIPVGIREFMKQEKRLKEKRGES